MHSFWALVQNSSNGRQASSAAVATPCIVVSTMHSIFKHWTPHEDFAALFVMRTNRNERSYGLNDENARLQMSD